MTVLSASKEPHNMIALVLILAYGLELVQGTYQISPTSNLESEQQLQHYKRQGNLQRLSGRRNSQANWTVCQLKCRCLENENHIVTTVDCSNSGLTEVPTLPSSAITVYLQGNSIENINCDAFDAVRLQTLNLNWNPLNDVRQCIFRNQIKSLKHLQIASFRIMIRISEPNNTFRGLKALTLLELSGGFFSRLSRLIPGMFSDLVNLKTLDLSNGDIERLEADTFVGLWKLRNLYLDFNINLSYQSGYDKNAFRGLTSLEVLNIKGSEAGTTESDHCEDYPDVALSALVSLKELHLDPCMNAPGPGFRELTNLTVLDMVRNCYYFKCGEHHQWPSDFFKNIRSQKELFINISGCHRTLGEGLFQPIPNIYSLDVSYNKCLNATGIAEMTKSLINSSIAYLYVSNISLPFGFFHTSILRHLKHTHLKSLVMRHNRIENSRLELSFLPHTMEDLDFSDNCLYFQEYQIIRWPQTLRTLRLNDQTYVTRCPISLRYSTLFNINDATVKHKWLGDLNTSSDGVDMNNRSASTQMFHNNVSNPASSLASPSSVLLSHPLLQTNETYTCQKLWRIKVKLPKSLEYFYLNRIYRYIDKCIPHVRVEGNVKLRHVELAQNNLMEWYGPVKNIPSLEFLDLSQNKCKHISLNFFKGMENLQILKIQENSVGKTLKEDNEGLIFAPLAKLRTLNLSKNLITTLDKHFHNLSDLRILDLSQNSIQYLPYDFIFYNVKLEVLNLSNNILDSFRPSLSRVKNMSRLDLSTNTMAGLSENCCENLKRLKSINPSFTVNLQNTRLLLSCDYFPFLSLLIKRPDIFENVEQLVFRHSNGTMTNYNNILHYMPEFGRSCFAQSLFIYVLMTFFLVLGTTLVSAVLYYNRWKLRYLYYIGQRRMHIGNTPINYRPAAQIYIIYDEDEPKWRRFLQQDFLPHLRHENIDYILGEVNFPSGDLMSSIAGAVVGTNKTLVLLSEDIFVHHYREIGVNLGIMKEINTRSQVLVPVWLERVDLAAYPAEIESFLQHQEFRCLAYEDNDMFWQQLLDAIYENA